jgi:hypothetical protein
LKENSLIGDKLLVTTTISVFSNHEVVLPNGWSSNVARRIITLSKKPQSSKIRYQIVDRGVYILGNKISEENFALGFTININGNDKVVMMPVNPTDWIEADATDLITSGDNIFDGIIWRNLIDLFDSYYVIFNLVLVCDDPEEITYNVKPIQQVTPQSLINLSGISSVIQGILGFVVIIFMLQFIFKIMDIFEEIIPSEKK